MKWSNLNIKSVKTIKTSTWRLEVAKTNSSTFFMISILKFMAFRTYYYSDQTHYSTLDDSWWLLMTLDDSWWHSSIYLNLLNIPNLSIYFSIYQLVIKCWTLVKSTENIATLHYGIWPHYSAWKINFFIWSAAIILVDCTSINISVGLVDPKIFFIAAIYPSFILLLYQKIHEYFLSLWICHS